MASTKKKQALIKQTTLLRWVRPDREPSPKKNENREETTSGIQANSSIKTTRQEPGLQAPPDLASSNLPKKSLETIYRSVPFNQRGSTSDNIKTECSCLETSPQTMRLGSCLCSLSRLKHPNK